jgi:hypothetical protein
VNITVAIADFLVVRGKILGDSEGTNSREYN